MLELKGVGQLQGIGVQLLIELPDAVHHTRVVSQIQVDLFGFLKLPLCPQCPGLRIVTGQQQIFRILVAADCQQQCPRSFIVSALQAPASVEVLLLQRVIVAQRGHFVVSRLQVQGLGLHIIPRGKESVAFLPPVQIRADGAAGQNQRCQRRDRRKSRRRLFPGRRQALLFLHAHSVK